jgi:hypothetical protein
MEGDTELGLPENTLDALELPPLISAPCCRGAGSATLHTPAGVIQLFIRVGAIYRALIIHVQKKARDKSRPTQNQFSR